MTTNNRIICVQTCFGVTVAAQQSLSRVGNVSEMSLLRTLNADIILRLREDAWSQ